MGRNQKKRFVIFRNSSDFDFFAVTNEKDQWRMRYNEESSRGSPRTIGRARDSLTRKKSSLSHSRLANLCQVSGQLTLHEPLCGDSYHSVLPRDSLSPLPVITYSKRSHRVSPESSPSRVDNLSRLLLSLSKEITSSDPLSPLNNPIRPFRSPKKSSTSLPFAFSATPLLDVHLRIYRARCSPL